MFAIVECQHLMLVGDWPSQHGRQKNILSYRYITFLLHKENINTEIFIGFYEPRSADLFLSLTGLLYLIFFFPALLCPAIKYMTPSTGGSV